MKIGRSGSNQLANYPTSSITSPMSARAAMGNTSGEFYSKDSDSAISGVDFDELESKVPSKQESGLQRFPNSSESFKVRILKEESQARTNLMNKQSMDFLGILEKTQQHQMNMLKLEENRAFQKIKADYNTMRFGGAAEDFKELPQHEKIQRHQIARQETIIRRALESMLVDEKEI